MLGVILVSIDTLLHEVGASIGKYEAKKHKESIFSMGLLSLLWVPVILIATGIARDSFFFDPASLPILLVRIILDIAQLHITMLAIVRADRSTTEFLRIITVPGLLLVDMLIGYQISLSHVAGMTLILLALIFLFINHGLKKRGMGLALFTAVNAVATISLFKYSVTNYNSVETD